MRRKVFFAVLLASCIGLLAAGAVASSAIFATHATTQTHSTHVTTRATTHAKKAAKATVITVIEGKPSELAFQLSKSTKLKVGTYTFKVTNKGLGFHTFKFCTAPVKTATKNTCVGKVTKVLHPGQSATLTVKIKKAGKYEYLCSVPGHAAAGMKGLIGVGVAVKAAPRPPATTTTTTTPTAPPTTTTTASGPPTANGCPYGTPAGTTIGSDEDGDESGTGADDHDGCL